MSDISLLPEDMREKEEKKREGTTTQATSTGGLKMHVPEAEPEEDIEIIEVDEGDLASVLADEPFMTRLTYKLSSAIDGIRGKLFEKREEAPPPKVPPQFFKPPKQGLVSKTPMRGGASIRPVSGASGAPVMRPASGGAGRFAVQGGAQRPTMAAVHGMPVAERPAAGAKAGEASRARITPQQGVPRRVRVIRRVRKPVRVSLISSKELAALTVDVTKRKWTLSFVACSFAAVLVGGSLFLDGQIADARGRMSVIEGELQSTRNQAQQRLKAWSAFEDLQDRLGLLDSALQRHIVISRFFDFLEMNTIPTVSYTGASWTAEGTLTLDATTDTFESAARQIVAFRQSDVVKRADSSSFMVAGGINGEPKRVTFQVLLALNPLAFQGAGLTPVAGSATSSASLLNR